MNDSATPLQAPESSSKDYQTANASSRRKRLGQCFTGELTARLLAALALCSTHRRVLDPMAGVGNLLEAVAQRAMHIGTQVELYGVEIDEEIARKGNASLTSIARVCPALTGHVANADAFQAATWKSSSNRQAFDLVITNPPYVRYQSLT